MLRYELSIDADARLSDIYAYFIKTWGLSTAQDYFLGLHECFEFLAGEPKAGRLFHEFRRHEYRSHIIFYTVLEDRIRVEQIYHKAQNIDDLF